MPLSQWLVNATVPNNLTQPLGFKARAVRVDNFTTQYLYLPDAGVYVDPGAKGAIILLDGIQIARVQWSAPPGKTQPSAVNGQIAQLTYYPVEEAGGAGGPFVPSPGIITPATDTNVGDFLPVDIAADPGSSGLAADAGHVHFFPDVTLDRYKSIADADDSPSITRALAALPSTGGRIRLSAKNYNISQAIAPAIPVTFKGVGNYIDNTAGGTTITVTAAVTGSIVFKFTLSGCHFENIQLIAGANGAAQEGVHFRDGTFGGGMRDCAIWGFTGGNGLALVANTASVNYIVIENVRVTNCGNGCSLIGNGPGAKAVNSNTFIGCAFVDNVATGNNLAIFHLASDNSFIGCDFTGTGTQTNVVVGNGDGLVRGNHFINCNVENGSIGYKLGADCQAAFISGHVTSTTPISAAAGASYVFLDTQNAKFTLQGMGVTASGVGAFAGGVGLDTVDHYHSHTHGSHAHTHNHGAHGHDLSLHTHPVQYGTSQTGAATAGTAHTHPYNDPVNVGFTVASGNPSPNATGGATPFNDSTAATPTADTTIQNQKHTHSG